MDTLEAKAIREAGDSIYSGLNEIAEALKAVAVELGGVAIELQNMQKK